MKEDLFAHSRNSAGQRQDLLKHLRQVAQMAEAFARPFGGQEMAKCVGLLHDIGKCDPEWQRYLLRAEQGMKMRGPDHKGAGAVLAWDRYLEIYLPFLIAGHHGGLPARANLKTWLRERARDPHVQEAIRRATTAFPELMVSLSPSTLLPASIRTPLEEEFFVRLLFSALVDADFLDTERHFKASKRSERDHRWRIADLWEQFVSHYREMFADVERNDLNEIRSEVYQYCLDAAHLPPGFFRLAVPTGGGKTLASLAFALQHALNCDRQRIIYAIPYTSIIDQTAQVFEKILGDAEAFIEHHSDLTMQDPVQPTLAEIRRRLATENWDASLIVTTTVQLFESLLSCQTGKCRKLHNIAQSVIVLDEVQMLPVHLLTTILDVLRQLVMHYGVTVVLCTATQPDFESRQRFEGLENVQDIIPFSEQKRHFSKLRRVDYQLPMVGETWTWEHVAAHVEAAFQILVVVNTRSDAQGLMDILTDDTNDDPALFHLSTRLCGAHRRVVLDEVRRRLKAGEACRLIATQVIEAGVDVDFPLVMRAIGPLDRIVQAAGRANREGKMSHPAPVIVFIPEGGHVPKAFSYRLGTDITIDLLRNADVDLHDPGIYQTYFREYYGYPNHDKNNIEAARKVFDYPFVAKEFRMIDDESISVIVKYTSPGSKGTFSVEERLKEIKAASHASVLHREYLRSLQPYTVGLLAYEFEMVRRKGLVQELIPGVWEWLDMSLYDSGQDGMHGQGIVLDRSWSVESLIW